MQLTRLLANSKTFSFWQSLGFHVVRSRFDSPIPDTTELGESTWRSRESLPGVDLRADEQLRLLESFARSYQSEYAAFPKEAVSEDTFFLNNVFFGSVDAEALYCFVRARKPKRIIEIGSGFSTLIAAQAMRRNAEDGGARGELIAIEPYPNEFLRKGFDGLSQLITKRVQDVTLDFFETLGPNDILFIDSSHVVKTGSDVCFEFLEILPRLHAGVVVHVHDIFFPSDYPRRQVMDLKIFYNEQYLLQAFLAFNSAYRVLWSSSLLHLRHSAGLARAFPSYDSSVHCPGSFWMERVQ